ncbi:MAG: hypothetical protein IJ880_03480 [Bacilli bacterium]|jgi:hypothetical protein|nr:hypothetical protein [Bacilli bacterium]
MSKTVKNPSKMKISGKKGRDTSPNVSKIKRAKKDMISEKVKGLRPGSGLDDYSLDVMTLD